MRQRPVAKSFLRRLAAGWLLVCAGVAGAAEPGSFPFRDTAQGMSCAAFDVELALGWPRSGVEWLDAAGTRGGGRAFASQTVARADSQPLLRWNILPLVQGWARGDWPNEGLLVVAASAQGGAAIFHARESPEIGLRPSLRVVHADGQTELLSPAADVHLDCSTVTSLGTSPTLKIAPDSPAALRFDLARLRKGPAATLRAAELILVRDASVSWMAPGELQIHRLLTPWKEPLPPPPAGLAAAYPRDAGLAQDPDVVFADALDRWPLSSEWNANDLARARVADQARSATQPAGRSLHVVVPRGENLGLDLRYDFRRHRSGEPEEIYMRYELRLDRAWLNSPDGGKLPGFGGTYGQAAWGGRGWDGHKGWSARGAFALPAGPGHPAHGRLLLGHYVYHSRASSVYGETLPWAGSDGRALLEPERWYTVEQHIRLNTPGRADGWLRAWVDGQPVFDRRDLQFRNSPALRIENVWMNVYLGGTRTASFDLPLQIAHVVIARRYIGPRVH